MSSAKSTRVREIMTDSVVTIEPDNDVRLAVQIMLWGGFRHLPVIDRGDLVGLVTEHDIHRAHGNDLDPSVLVRTIMTTDVQTADPDELVTRVATRMAESRIGSMPILEDGGLVGIVTSTDLIAHLGRGFLPPASGAPRVRDVMTPSPRSVRASQTLTDALAEMVTGEFRHLPVVDDDDRLVGILTDRDVRGIVGDPLTVLRDETFGETLRLTVDEVMTTSPIAVRAEDPIEALGSALLDERVGAVPVIDGERRLVGIVSYVDVLQHALRGRGA
jgi:CBS domain-containing protein